MTAGRLAAYCSLAAWEGGLGLAAWRNFLDARPGYLAANAVLLVGILVALAAMRRTDRRAGRLSL